MNTKIEVTGTCAYVGEVQEFAGGFKKRTFVLREESQGQDGKTYTHLLACELKREAVNLVNESCRNQQLTVVGFVESRSWKNPQTGELKFFTEVTARKVSLVATMNGVPQFATPTTPTPAPTPATPPPATQNGAESDPFEGLPF